MSPATRGAQQRDDGDHFVIALDDQRWRWPLLAKSS